MILTMTILSSRVSLYTRLQCRAIPFLFANNLSCSAKHIWYVPIICVFNCSSSFFCMTIFLFFLSSSHSNPTFIFYFHFTHLICCKNYDGEEGREEGAAVSSSIIRFCFQCLSQLPMSIRHYQPLNQLNSFKYLFLIKNSPWLYTNNMLALFILPHHRRCWIVEVDLLSMPWILFYLYIFFLATRLRNKTISIKRFAMLLINVPHHMHSTKSVWLLYVEISK